MASIDNVQSCFLRYLSYKFAMVSPKKKVAFKLGLHTLSSIRKFYDVSFIFEVLNNKIHCPEILEKEVCQFKLFITSQKLPFMSHTCSILLF